MQQLTMPLKIDKNGRINVPRHIRDALGIEANDLVKVTIEKIREDEGETGNPCESPAIAST